MDFEIWNYPQVDTLSTMSPEPSLLESIDEQASQEPAFSAEEQQRQQEIQAQMHTLSQHLHAISNLQQTLENQVRELNEQALIKITSLIKTTSEKIIQRELSIDQAHLIMVIQQALKEIHNEQEPCSIFIASEQYEFIKAQDAFLPQVNLKPDASLQPGDFKIKTVHSELESILNNRLTELFGLSAP
jgi:flagellar biosynthesis/type III secretory pathway protein FliH